MSQVSHLNVSMGYDSLEEAFPDVECGHVALGTTVIVQLRVPKSKTKGGVILASDTRDTEQWNTQVAKVVEVGPVAFRNRQTMQSWPEGAWAKKGDYVRVPKYAGDKWQVEFVPKGRMRTQDDVAIFCIFNDLELKAKIPDPLTVKSFV